MVRDHISITSDTRYLSVIREFISRMIRQSALAREEENKLILAVDEAVTNIIEHGYDNVTNGPIDIEVEYDDAIFRIYVRDSGKRFNPETISDPDIMEHVRLGKKKGLGIFLMRQIMDEVRYSFREGIKNEVSLTKYIKRRPA
jgi:serine/threonine-protein kinase RsbW